MRESVASTRNQKVNADDTALSLNMSAAGRFVATQPGAEIPANGLDPDLGSAEVSLLIRIRKNKQ